MTKPDKLSHIPVVNLGGRAQPRIVTFDIGGTWTRAVLGTDYIDQAEIVRTPTLPDYSQMLGKLGNISATLLDGKRADAVGFGIAGQITDGTITKAGKLAEYGYVGKNIVVDISDQTGLDPARVAGNGDTHSAAFAERRFLNGNVEVGGIYTWSTGFGGTRFTPDSIMPDEPGHEFFEAGALCGCGGDGCLEAHVSGSGIERKYGVRGENIPAGDPRWAEVTSNMAAGLDMMLDRYEGDDGLVPTYISFYGSVAMKGPGVLDGVRSGIQDIRGSEAPQIGLAAYGDESGLYGAYFAALDTL